MAFHDDVDDANDANDKTSSEHEFELPFPKSAVSKNDGSDSAADATDDGLVDLSEASTDNVLDLDAALAGDEPESVSTTENLDAPSGGAFPAAPFDLNDEFQRSDVADALDQGIPPWAMAPAPDPNQAVSQLDAPEVPEAPAAPAAPEGNASDEDDPYQIPADYTTPDFFASRISRRRTPQEAEEENAAAAAAELAESEDESEASSAAQPERSGDAADPGTGDGHGRSDEFSFDSLFAPERPAGSSVPTPPASADDFDDTMWADVSPVSGADEPTSVASESDAPANHIWKLGPLEPEVVGSSPASPASPAEPPADVETSIPVEDVVEGAPMWNLDDQDAPVASAAPSLGFSGLLSLDDADESKDESSRDDTVVPVVNGSATDETLESDTADELPAVDSVSAVDLDAAFQQAASVPVVGSDEGETKSEIREEEAEDSAAVATAPSDHSEFELPFTPRQSFVAPSREDSAPRADEVFGAAQSPSRSDSPAEGVPFAHDREEGTSNPSESGEVRETEPTLDTGEAAASELPAPPTRRSMADDELLTWADNPANQSTGALSVIEVLEAQLRLREEEAREYREWETTLRSRNAPVADQVIDDVRSEFSDVVDTDASSPAESGVPEALGATSEEPVVPEEPAALQEPAAPEEAPVAPLPAWEVPPPSESWSPPADFEDEIPFAAHADPTGSITLPPAADTAAVDAVPADIPDLDSPSEPDKIQQPAEEQASTAPLFDPASGLLSFESAPTASEAAAAEAAVASGASQGHSEQAAAAEGSEIAAGESEVQAAPDSPSDEEGDYDELPFAPPALVEPEIAPSVPRANLDEHVSFGDFGFTPPPADLSAASASDDGDSEQAVETPFAFDLSADAQLPESPQSESPETSSPIADSESDDGQTPAAPEDVDVVSASVDKLAQKSTPEASSVASAFSFASTENPPFVPSEPLSFDDLLKADEIESTDRGEDEAAADPLMALLADAAPPLHGDPLSEVQTGSIAVNQFTLEAESDDAVADSDRLTYPTQLSAGTGDPSGPDASVGDEIPFAAGAAVAGASLASQPAPIGAAVPLPAPSETVSSAASSASLPQPVAHSTTVVAQQPLGLDDVAPTAHKVFSLEESGLEPTPVDRRVGHAARMFWLWFAANSSIVSLGLGAAVFAVGMSLRQSVVAILVGVALSFIPLGFTTLAGKRSGQPTMVVSRASFGVVGNIAPSIVALVARLFWGAVLLWVLTSSVAIVLIGSDLNGALGDRQLLLIALALSFLIALVIAFAGYPLFARIQLIISIISGVLVVGLIGFTAQYVDVSQALTTPDGSWLLTVTGAVLVFSFLGLVWAYSGADIARYQRPSSSGGASMLSATFGAALPAFALIAYGALLAASDPAIARGFLASPLDTLVLLLPSWYPIPLLLAATLSLLSGITLSLYSGGFALQAIGVRVPRQWSIVIVAVLLGALSILFAFGVDGGINELFRDVATTLAVPTAAWVGIFASETMIRNRKLDSAALLSRGGVYGDVRWVNLGAFVVISAIGFALTSATISWLSWQGYGFAALGVDLSSELAGTDLGVLVALGLGLLTPLVAGIPAIRRQEAAQAERAPRRA